MYISRTIEKKVNELTKEFKVLVVTGARQVGKSTMLKHCDPKRTYVSLGRPNIREFANSEPELFLQPRSHHRFGSQHRRHCRKPNLPTPHLSEPHLRDFQY